MNRSGRAREFALGAVGGAAAATLLGAALRGPQLWVARMPGSSIAGPDAVGWVTDFLNAAYYRRPPERRDTDDLRLAFAVLVTRWQRRGYRRLRAYDLAAFHRAFYGLRMSDSADSRRGTLDREQLLEGAGRLHGDWFADAWSDPSRRGWGIVFRSHEERAAYQPEQRLRHATLGPLSPPVAPSSAQTWHTYPPVPVDDGAAVLAALTDVSTWPDYASEIGRFTPVREGGLAGQTFEIEVTARQVEAAPLWLRAYVTVTRLVTQDEPAALHAYVEEVNEGLARFGHDEPPAVPDGAGPVAALDLASHEGHFMGRARNRLLVYTDGGQSYLRAAGTWDPLRWHLSTLYERAGYYAQRAFWGAESPAESMLHQIARQTRTAIGVGE